MTPTNTRNIKPGSISARIYHHLLEHGGATARELAHELGVAFDSVSARLGSLKHMALVHIGSWRRDEEHGRLYPRAVWVAGSGDDAKKLRKLTSTEYGRRGRNRKRGAVPSVFMLGTPVDHRRLTGRRRGVVHTST